MADLIRSLRNLSDQPYRIGGPACDTIAEAADEIERLREIERFLRDDLPDSKKWVERAEALLSDSAPVLEGPENG